MMITSLIPTQATHTSVHSTGLHIYWHLCIIVCVSIYLFSGLFTTNEVGVYMYLWLSFNW